MDLDVKDTLLALEAKGWEALSNAGQAGPFYEKHLAENAVMVLPSGVLNREAALQAMRSAAPWSRYQIEDSRVVELTAECAALIYKVTARRTGEPTFTAIVSSTYVISNGMWLLVMHQQSPAA